MAHDVHPDGLRCPSCRSTNVVCHGRPHGHECNDCGYDGAHPLDQALNLIRRHAEVCSRHGESERLRTEADRIEALAGTTTTPEPARTPLWTTKTLELTTRSKVKSMITHRVFDLPPGTEVQVFARSVVTDPDTTEADT